MSTGRALLVGGTGPTGPHIVEGLQQRGFEVTLLHRGTHELPEQAALEHIHADPHFAESVSEAVGDRHFDLVVATYGRLRHVAAAFAGRCEQFIAVSGAPVYQGYHVPESRNPIGIPVSATESDVGWTDGPEPTDDASRFSQRILAAERSVFDLHDSGTFSASIFRYPSIYGPRQLYPREWSIVKRIRDGRSTILMPDNGLTISSRCAAVNAAGFLLAAVDRPDAAAGEVFNVGDVQQFSLRQWCQLISGFAGGSLEVVSLPFDLAGPGRGLFPVPHDEHGLLSIHKARTVLGYVEMVSAGDALRDTTRWYLDNPPDERTTSRMTDKFDYAAEDALLAAYRHAAATMAEFQQVPETAPHPYAHPKTVGAVDHRGR